MPVRDSRWLREIRTLDPERDCRRIVYLDVFHEFPFDTTRALELAFFKTFAVPSIAELLDSTGEFVERGQKRSSVAPARPPPRGHGLSRKGG